MDYATQIKSTTLARPIYLIAGGTRPGLTKPDPTLAHIVALAGRPRPAIAYIGVASNDDRDFLNWLTIRLRRAGAGVVRLVKLAAPDSDLGQARSLLQEADMIFVSGGDVAFGMFHLRRKRIIPFLKRLYLAGKRFAGLSAGSIMLARCWVHWADPDDDSTASTFPCLGLAPIVCDTHGEGDDWGELKTLMRIGRPAVGYGIPSGAVLRVDADGGVAALVKPVQRFAHRGGRIIQMDDLRPGRTAPRAR